MSKSKAVSSEFNNLLSKIETQANEYEKTFEILNEFIRNADRAQRAIEEATDRSNILYAKKLELYEKFSAVEQYIDLRLDKIIDEVKIILDTIIIEKFNKNAEKIFNDFQKQAESSLKMLEESEGIIAVMEKSSNEMNNKVTELDNKNLLLYDKLAELDNNFFDVQTKNAELDDMKKNFNEITKYSQDKITEFENKIENKIIHFFNETNDKYDSMFNNLIFNTEERIKNTILDVKEAQILINQKIRTIDEKMNSFAVLSNELFKHIKELKEKSNPVKEEENNQN